MALIAKKILVILSGKGGVGKSTVACQIALCYKEQGLKVGLLDIDLCGPSIPTMLNIHNSSVMQSPSGKWVPVFYETDQTASEAATTAAAASSLNDTESSSPGSRGGTLEVMSIGFLLSSETDAVIWRGPKKNAMIKQFLTDVEWSDDLDLLVIDTPPGTSDEHMSIVEHVRERIGESNFSKNVAAVLVTSPQAVSVHDVQREIGFCRKCKLNILGIIENMSGFICSHCSHCSYIFSQGGGKALAAKKDIEFLGTIPVDTNLALAVDRGENFIRCFNSSVAVGFIEQIIVKMNCIFFEIDNEASSVDATAAAAAVDGATVSKNATDVS